MAGRFETCPYDSGHTRTLALAAAMRYKTTMRHFLAMLIVVLLVAPVWAGEERIALHEKAYDAATDFSYRPDRNTTFTAPDDAQATYRLVQALVLELDYRPTEHAVERGDQLGPFLSLSTFYQGKLTEALMVHLRPTDEGTEVTIRGVFVLPAKGHMLDRSERRPTWTVRHFERYVEAKRQLAKETGETSTHAILARAQENLSQKRDLEGTLGILHLVERATRPRCMAGRQARELIHAVEGQLERRASLQAAVDQQRAKMTEATTSRNWLQAFLAGDQWLHILLEGGVAADDPEILQVRAELDKNLRRLRAAGGSVVLFDQRTAPAEGNDVAVGFTALNAGTRPVAQFKVRVDSSDAAGRPSPGRIGRAYSFTVDLDPPLMPGECYPTAVVLRFETPSEVAGTRVRVVGLRTAKK